MSGGSYNYLCYMQASDLFSEQVTLQNMADDLAELGYANDVAKETEQLLLTVRSSLNRIKAMQERLEPVFHAMEWWKSCDSSEESLKEALKEYRGSTRCQVKSA